MYEIPFIDACLNRSASPEDVESYVEYWHTHDISRSLREFLGMSAEEYALWLQSGDDALPVILKRRKGRGVFYGMICPYCHAKGVFVKGGRYQCRSCGAVCLAPNIKNA